MAMTEKQLRKTAETAEKNVRADIVRQAKVVFHNLESQYEQCREALLSIPDEIEKEENIISDLQRRVEECGDDVEIAESMIFMQVSEIVDSKGKKLYSNKEARDAAVTEMKRKDEEYRAAVKSLRTAEQKVESAKFKVNKLDKKLKACRSMAEMLASRMYLYSKCSWVNKRWE